MPNKTELPLFDRSALAFIRRNVRSLVQLVTELLDFTHVASESLWPKLQKMDAHQVIRFALKNLDN